MLGTQCVAWVDDALSASFYDASDYCASLNMSVFTPVDAVQMEVAKAAMMEEVRLSKIMIAIFL